MEDGGGGTLQPHSLGTGDKCPPPTHPKFPSFVWNWECAQTCFILRDQTDYRRFKIPSFTSQGHTHNHVHSQSCLCSPRPLFLSAELWVISYHLGNLGIIIDYRMYSQYHNTRNIIFCAKKFGGGGVGTCPTP